MLLINVNILQFCTSVCTYPGVTLNQFPSPEKKRSGGENFLGNLFLCNVDPRKYIPTPVQQLTAHVTSLSH